MHITTLQDTTAKALPLLDKTVATRSTLPVLNHVLIEGAGETATYTTTDLELALRVTVGAKVMREGRAAIPQKTLKDLVATMPAAPLTLDLNERTQTTTITCGRVTAKLKGIAADEFPQVPTLDVSKAIAIGAQDLRAMIAGVSFAADRSADTPRPILRTVALSLGAQFVAAATDGFRVAEMTRDITGPACAAVLPVRAADLLAQIIDGADEVLMQLTATQALFLVGQYEMVTQLVDGQYPVYSGIMPKSYKTRVVLDKAAAVKACKSVDVIARNAAHAMRIEVKPGTGGAPGYVVLSGTAAETGDNEAEVDAAIEGDAVALAANAAYVRQAVESVGTPTVALEFGSPTSPFVVRPVGTNGHVNVVMPMHLDGGKLGHA